MTLKQIEYFVTVVNTGSMSKAALKLHVSQPPLSMQIKELEEELGTTLLERTTRRIRVTDAGRLFYRRAVSILDLTAAARNDIRTMDEHISGRLVIGTISSCHSIVLGPAIQKFSRLYPDVNFELVEGHTYLLLDKLNKREIALAFARSPFKDSGVNKHFLFREPMAACGAPDLFPEGAPIKAQQLLGRPLILYRRFEEMITGYLSGFPGDLHVRCLCDDARTAVMWAAAGIGIAIVPRSITEMMAPGRLHVRDITDEPLCTSICIVTRQGQYLSPAAEKFIEVYT